MHVENKNSAGYTLPWIMDPLHKDNGFLIKTVIQGSTVLNDLSSGKLNGIGRFITEDVQPNTLIHVAKIVDGSSGMLNPGTYVKCDNIQILKNTMMACEDSQDITPSAEQIVHFAGTPDNIAASHSVYYLAPSFHTNHGGDHSNFKMIKLNDYMYTYSTKFIKAGNELLNDYRQHDFPKWFLEYCNDVGIPDLSTFGRVLPKG